MQKPARDLEMEVAQLHAQLAITNAAIADLAASVALRSPNPEAFLGAWSARLLGNCHAAGHGLGEASGAPRTTRAIERMVGWAESFLRDRRGPEEAAQRVA